MSGPLDEFWFHWFVHVVDLCSLDRLKHTFYIYIFGINPTRMEGNKVILFFSVPFQIQEIVFFLNPEVKHIIVF